jgi:hypothetical protein
MRIHLDDAIMSCADVAEEAYNILLEIPVGDKQTREKIDKICALLNVLAISLDALTERVHEELRLQSPPSEMQPGDD